MFYFPFSSEKEEEEEIPASGRDGRQDELQIWDLQFLRESLHFYSFHPRPSSSAFLEESLPLPVGNHALWYGRRTSELALPRQQFLAQFTGDVAAAFLHHSFVPWNVWI